MPSLPSQRDESPRGLLNPAGLKTAFDLQLFDAPTGLEYLVDHVWLVRWDLPDGQTHSQSNMPHPVQHIVLDPLRGSGLYGCQTKRFDYELTGRGQVLGLKLLPGLGRAFIHQDISVITDDVVPLDRLLGGTLADALEGALSSSAVDADLLNLFAQSVSGCAGAITSQMHQARYAVEMVEATQEAFRVADVCELLDIEVRHLQRLFASHVGVSPKWVIDRYRLLEALGAMNAGQGVNIADLALRLGYYDQSHFSNLFKRMTGISPAQYLNQQG